MSEDVRYIAATLTVDTNKRTIMRELEADSLDDLLEQFRATVAEVSESL